MTNTSHPTVVGAITPLNQSEHETHSSTHALFIRALLMLSMILVTMNINGFLHKIRFHYLSESAVTILLGLVVAMGWTAISYDETNADIQLSSDFFYMVLLPPIIFEGGFTLQRVSFFTNFLTIFSLAFFGALYSTIICSVLMYFFSKLIFPWSFVESLVFGSLISSTDPVTVLALLPSTVDRRLYMLIFGESALNDAVAIILYRFFTGLADPKMRLGVGPLFVSVFASAGVFFGSFFVGVALGLGFAYITKHVKMPNSTVYEITMLLVFAYCSYLLADVLGLTGIISIFFCGITMAQYAVGNLSDEARKASRVTLRVLAFMCECFIFLYLGLGLLSFGRKTVYDPLMILFAIISILVSRTHVFVILGFKNWIAKNDTPIPFNQQVLIWFSGLRGAVAFALGVTFLEHPVFAADVKGIIFGTTVMVVVLTVIVIGGLTPYMLVWLGVSPPQSHEGDEHHEAAEQGTAGPAALKEDQAAAEGGSSSHSEAPAQAQKSQNSLVTMDEDLVRQEAESKPVFGWLYNLDQTYIRPYFTNRTVDAPFRPKTVFAQPIGKEEIIETPRVGSLPPSHRGSVVVGVNRMGGYVRASKTEIEAEGDDDLEVLVKKEEKFGIE
ncbi:Sodium/hydrogen exchanger 8 [Chytridiales sp. JEL 0842]|nr:Sodium/hydrogen exchanger 8 [Chytridiales sp. JEL 0842]